MYRHFPWLQAIENGSHPKIALPDRTSQCREAQGCARAAFGWCVKKPWMDFSTKN